MVRVTFEYPTVSTFGGFEFFLLFVHVTDLKPDVLFRQRTRRVGYDVFEAVQALVELLLLLVDYAKAEVDFVGFFEARLHAHDLREGFFGVLKRPIAVVEDTNAVPELWFLGI